MKRLLGRGRTAAAWLVSDSEGREVVEKRSGSGKWTENFKRESRALEILKEFSWTPDLYDANVNDAVITMSYTGTSLDNVDPELWPKDFLEQATKIYEDMKSINFNHNDIKRPNMTLMEGKIYLIDFGYCSLTSKTRNPEGQLGFNDFSLGDPEIENTTEMRHCFPGRCDWKDFERLEKFRLGEIDLKPNQ